MNGINLLDTNIVIALLNGDALLEAKIANADELFVPSIVLGELYFGAEKSNKVGENVARIEAFARQRSVLNCDMITARFYGKIRHQLKLKGRPIPENDIWIAAIAMQHGLTVVTRDTHFREIDGLLVEAW